MRHSRTLYGKCPETVGWKKLTDWLAKGNKLSTLALKCGVQAPSAHAWRWRDSVPADHVQEIMKEILGTKDDDWRLLVERKPSRKSTRGAAA